MLASFPEFPLIPVYVVKNLNLHCIKGALALFVLVSFSGYVCYR